MIRNRIVALIKKQTTANVRLTSLDVFGNNNLHTRSPIQKPKIGIIKALKACLSKVFTGALSVLNRLGQFFIQPKQKSSSVLTFLSPD